MTEEAPSTPSQWRNFHTRVPIKACRLRSDDFKRLYRLIDQRQKEYRDKAVQLLFRQEKETEEEFVQKKKRITDAFVVSVTIAGENGELLTGNREEVFDELNLPSEIKSILYSTQSVPNAVLGHLPSDRIVLFLDFSRPPFLDFSRMPSLPTPNESNFEISANTEVWFAAAKAMLGDFFENKRTGYEWLHRNSIYDLMLWFIVFPVALWICARTGNVYSGINKLSTFPRLAIYSYLFLGCLVIYRILFSYSRWVFPKIEMEREGGRRSPFRHRVVWGAIVLAIVLPALYDIVKQAVFVVLG
jgi:hypothetical protein